VTTANHTMPDLTDKQRANLAKLSAYLRGPLKAQFDMSRYWQEDECGSVGCAVGHGPLAGIVRRDLETWFRYAPRAFGASHEDACKVRDWCFSAFWALKDNTPDGAADRIDYMLKNGIPDEFMVPSKQWVSVYSGAKP